MFNMKNRTYDILQWLIGVVFPAFVVLYSVLGSEFNLPYVDKVGPTILAVMAFVGVILQNNRAAWFLERVATYGTTILDNNNDNIPDYPFKMSGLTYDALKFVAQVLLPVLITLWVAVVEIWGVVGYDYIPIVVGGVVMFLGTILQISSWQRNNSLDK